VSSLRFAPRRALPLVALLTALAAGGADASVVVDVPLERMVEASDAIVIGSVESTGSRLEARGGRLQPVTRTRVRVLRWLKGGEGEPRLTVRSPGGAHPGGERRVVGAPRFRPGEQVLLFLKAEDDAYVPFGLALGVYRIDRGRGAAPARVARHADGLRVAERRDGRMVLSDADEAPVALSALVARVQALLAAGEGAPR
jgi:hypothetical protein